MKPPVILRIGAAALVMAALQGCAQQAPVGKPAVAPPRATPAPPVCADMSFPVYFANASRDLAPAALGVIADAASRLKGCAIGRIDIIGLADAEGTSAANLALSRRRGQTVAQALTAAGLPIPAGAVQAFGQTGALTPAGDPEPLRRRVEVIIHASPPPAPSAAAAASPAKENGTR